MKRYVMNKQTAVVHRANGCPDAKRYGRTRGWRSVGVWANLEIASIEAKSATDKTPSMCSNCAR